jgi:hypothetical protein
MRSHTRSTPMVTDPILSASPSPRQNQILAALPAEDYERLLRQLEHVPMPLGWAIYEADDAQGYVYFPTNSIVSLLYVMRDGSSAEIAVVGNEGVVGIALFMGGETTPSRAVVPKRGPWLSAQCKLAENRIRSGRGTAASAAALHAGADHADGADRGVQPPPRGRAAAAAGCC